MSGRREPARFGYEEPTRCQRITQPRSEGSATTPRKFLPVEAHVEQEDIVAAVLSLDPGVVDRCGAEVRPGKGKAELQFLAEVVEPTRCERPDAIDGEGRRPIPVFERRAVVAKSGSATSTRRSAGNSHPGRCTRCRGTSTGSRSLHSPPKWGDSSPCSNPPSRSSSPARSHPWRPNRALVRTARASGSSSSSDGENGKLPSLVCPVQVEFGLALVDDSKAQIRESAR